MESREGEPGVRAALQNVGANLLVIWLAVLAYHWSSYYERLLADEIQMLLAALAVAYTVVAIPAHLVGARSGVSKETHSRVLLRVLATRTRDQIARVRAGFGSGSSGPAESKPLDHHERTSILFLVVKVHFLPMLLGSAYSSFGNLSGELAALGDGATALVPEVFAAHTFLAVMSLLFVIDSSFFTFGYAFESPRLNNEIRSVDSTWSGWLAALACYDPVSGLTVLLIGYKPSHVADYGDPRVTMAVLIIVLVLSAIFVWATLALGTRCSNLTNRGIVEDGPYAYVRHPAYVTKIVTFWLVALPFMSGAVFLGLCAWSAIYYARVVTEERHLIQDPDYQAYCEKVRFRFIPRVI